MPVDAAPVSAGPRGWRGWPVAPPALVIAGLFFYPLALIARQAFVDDGGALAMGHLIDVLHSRLFVHALLGTLEIALAATAIRCIQGFSAGGEIGTITSFIAEYAGPGRRGFSTSWLMVTAVLGLLLGGAVVNGMTWACGADFMQHGGWRIPFLIAAPMGVISLYIRLKLEDSPEFLALAHSGRTSKAPLHEALRHKRAIALVFCIITLHSSIFYLLLTFASTFMAKLLKFDSGTTLLFTAIATFVSAAVMPFGGMFTDRYGRRPFLFVVGVLATLAMAWFFIAAPGATPAGFFPPLIAVALTFGFYASSTYATMSELLPTRIRSTGIAIAYNLPVALFGGCAPLVSTWLIKATGQLSAPWYFFVPTGIVSIIALCALRQQDFARGVGMSADAAPNPVDVASPGSPRIGARVGQAG